MKIGTVVGNLTKVHRLAFFYDAFGTEMYVKYDKVVISVSSEKHGTLVADSNPIEAIL